MESETLFKSAYDLHYKQKNIEKALEVYNSILSQYPESKEAEYARNQIENINNMSEKDKLKMELKKEENENLNVILTTAPFLEGYEIEQTINIITSECVLGMNMFKDLFASITDIVGGRSGTIQKSLREAREQCLYELKNEAASCGANAVIAVDLDYSEISGGGKSMLFLVASGTAVKVIKTNIKKQIKIEETKNA
jgi:uncharacterized protein YbjQ (UPF0145 family)